MTKLEQAQELFRLQELTRRLIAECFEVISAALAEPSNSELIKESERKVAELSLVQNEFKARMESWQTNY